MLSPMCIGASDAIPHYVLISASRPGLVPSPLEFQIRNLHDDLKFGCSHSLLLILLLRHASRQVCQEAGRSIQTASGTCLGIGRVVIAASTWPSVNRGYHQVEEEWISWSTADVEARC